MDYDITKLAKYPFLNEAKQYVASLGLGFAEILNHPVYSACIELGRQRLLDCIKGKYSPDISDKLSAQLVVLSYPIARIFVNLIGSKRIIDQYSQVEASVSYKFLMGEQDQVVKEVLNDLGVRLDDEGMPVPEYLKLSSSLVKENTRWKLVNRTIKNGLVGLRQDESKELLREAIRLRIMEPVDVSKAPEELKNIAETLKASLTGSRDKISAKDVRDDALPECIQNMLKMLEQGTASHNVMFILATFFLNLGLKKDDVINIFRVSPKFSEDVAAYQIDFLSGEKGGTQYTCPTCETIRSYGLGCSDCTFKHPLQKYRINVKTRRGRRPSFKKEEK